MSDPVRYEGSSAFLRWWPKGLVALAAVILVIGWPKSIQWATLLVAVAFLHSRWVPWRFVIEDDGLFLTFPFGHHVFLPKTATSIRLEYVGAFALVGRHRRFGYPLSERFVYEPGQRPRLQRAFAWFGYDIVA
ncbi:MAG TPA: hypothetical protein VIJ47_14305 [Acidimicrobiales bacterium]